MAWTYRPDLDGLRTIAVYLVLLFHTGLGWAGGGFIGVDLFFVLSGFLVSSVILGEVDRTGRLDVGRFWSRRVRRLLPAALVTIVATSVTFTLIWSVVQRADLVADARSSLLYYANWHFLAESGDYFAADVDKSPFLHFWSLAIEEQFYLAFPLVLMLASRVGRRHLFAVVAALFTLSLASQLYWGQVDPTRAYYATDARLYQLLAGALLTVALRNWPPRVSARAAHSTALAGLVGLLLLGSGLVDVSPSVRGLGATLTAVLLIGGLFLAEDRPLTRVLSSPVPVFLGRISYGTYLWHWPVIIALTTLIGSSPPVVAFFAVAISTGLAALSYEVLEMPIRRAELLERLRWRPAVAGVAASALLAVTFVPWVLELDRKPEMPAAAGNEAGERAARGTAGAEPVPQDVDWTEVAKDIGATHWCPPDKPSDCTIHTGGGPHLLFVGDSQAATFVPMFEDLAEEHDLTLSVSVTPGCAWQEGLANAELSEEGQQSCEKARVGWYDEALPELDPDVVVLLSRPRDDPKKWRESVTRRDGKQQGLRRAVLETSRETLAKIDEVADHTLIVERLIMPEDFDANECLARSRTIADCAVPVPTEPSATDGFMATASVQFPSVSTVNWNDALCPDAPVCLPVVDGEPVWRDDHHYTATYALERREQVWRLLARTGAVPAD